MRGQAMAGRAGFLRDDRGNTVIEFALIFPMLMLLLFGMIEITNMLMVNRKVVATAQNLADLVTRFDEIAPSQFSQFDDAVRWMLDPFPADASAYGIAHVAFDAGQVPTLDAADGGWTHDSGLTVASATDRADGLGIGGDAIVVVELTYQYEPVVGSLILQPMTFRHIAYSRPRNEPQIVLLP
jgi:Flp pilus assembly protein TadG